MVVPVPVDENVPVLVNITVLICQRSVTRILLLLIMRTKFAKKNVQAETVMDDLKGIGDGDDIHDLLKDFKDLWFFLKSMVRNKKKKWTKQMKHYVVLLLTALLRKPSVWSGFHLPLARTIRSWSFSFQANTGFIIEAFAELKKHVVKDKKSS